MPYVSDDDRQALIDTAERLQIDPRTLAAVINYESSFNPRSIGPSGRGYPVRGLIGFDPQNVRRYGMPAPTIAAQMPQVAQYLLDRGWKPGQYRPDDLGRLYSIVNAGSLDKNSNPRWGARDINGSIADHVRNIQARHYGAADRVLAPGPNPMDAIDAAIGVEATGEHWAPRTAMADTGSIFRDAGFNVPGAKPAAPESPAGAPAVQSGAAPTGKSIFEDAGFRLPTGKPVAEEPKLPAEAPAGATGYIQMPGIGGRRYVDAQGKLVQPENVNPQPAPLSQRVREAASDLASNYGTATGEAYKGSAAMENQGLQDVRDALYARGIGKVALGGAGMVLSPLTGAYELGAQGIDKLTGVPGTGEKAELLPLGPMVGRAALKATVPHVAAVDQLVKDIGKENIPGFINRLQANPTLAPMDVAPGVQTRAMGIATGGPSPGQTHLFDVSDQRNLERRQNVKDAFGSTIGAPPNTVQMLDQMKEDARAVGSQLIEPALRGAGYVDVTPIVKDIDDQLGKFTIARLNRGQQPLQPLDPVQQRLIKLRQELTFPNPMTGNPFPIKDQYFMDPTTGPVSGAKGTGAHGVQSRLRYEAENLSQSASGQDRLIGGTIGRLRGKLVDAIDQAAGGQYKPALAAYRDEMNVQEAFDKGMTITSGARTGEAGLENRPEAWAKWVQTAQPREMEAARLGARVVIDNHIGTIKQAGRAGLDIPDAPFTRGKMETLFGKDETDRLVNLLRDERAKAETNSLLTRNSKTARSQAAQQETRPREVEPLTAYTQKILPAAVLEAIQAPLTGTPGLATAGVLTYGAMRKGGQMALRARDIARNTAYARLAADATPEGRQALMSELRSRIQPVGAPNKLTNALRAFGQPLISP